MKTYGTRQPKLPKIKGVKLKFPKLPKIGFGSKKSKFGGGNDYYNKIFKK